MNVYLDSTLVIRQLVGTGSPWEGWGTWTEAYASTLLRAECCRTANLLRLEGKLDDAQRARLGGWIERVCESVTLVPVTEGVLRRAGDAFPTAVGTVGAIHLATMLELQAVHAVTCQLATVDDELLRAAQSMGFSDALAARPTPVEPAVSAEGQGAPAAVPAASAP